MLLQQLQRHEQLSPRGIRRQRCDHLDQALGKAGVSFRDIYWTVGPYDLVGIVEAPDDETATAALLSVAGQGNIRTITLRAFDAGEMRGVIEKAT